MTLLLVLLSGRMQAVNPVKITAKLTCQIYLTVLSYQSNRKLFLTTHSFSSNVDKISFFVVYFMTLSVNN